MQLNDDQINIILNLQERDLDIPMTCYENFIQHGIQFCIEVKEKEAVSLI